MSGKRYFLILLFFCETAFSQHLLFTGDVMLSRNVATEIEIRQQQSPWKNIGDLFSSDSVLVGNFEGAVGSMKNCAGNFEKNNLCFATDSKNLKYLKEAHFGFLSLENNHARDLGKNSIQQTKLALQKLNIKPLTFNDSPTFFSVNGTIIGIVSYSEIPGKNDIALTYSMPVLAQKIRLAHQLANIVVVYVHWGHELLDWGSNDQRKKAKWLIKQGADIIIGHHPHVIQKAECISGKPVLFSLGNHIFDQKYPITKQGTVIDCVPGKNKFSCKAYITQTPLGSSFPVTYHEDKSNYTALNVCAPKTHKLFPG